MINGFYLWIAFAAAMVGGLFSTLHMSLRDLSRHRVEELAGRDGKRNGELRRLAPILERPFDHALAISIPRIALNLAVALFSILAFTSVGPESRVDWEALLWAGLTAFALLYVLGLVVPTSLADSVGDAVVYRCASLIRAIHFFAAPVAHAVRFIDMVIKRLAGAEEKDEREELENELISVVNEHEIGRSLTKTEIRMIEAAIEFPTTPLAAVMTPRTEIEGFELTDDLHFIRRFISHAGHSRIPVYEGDLDHIVGVLYAKDLLQYLGKDTSGFELRSILREPVFVPETKPVVELLTELQYKNVHIALVLDEYGGTAGLVTMEDLLEEIVGEIKDEYEPATEAPPRIEVLAAERAMDVDARAYIDDVNEKLESIDAELPESEDYDTVGGLVNTMLGHIPTAGESFTRNGFTVRVIEAEPTRVTRVRIEFHEEEAPSAAPTPEEGGAPLITPDSPQESHDVELGDREPEGAERPQGG